jgi:hypothetical protein
MCVALTLEATSRGCCSLPQAALADNTAALAATIAVWGNTSLPSTTSSSSSSAVVLNSGQASTRPFSLTFVGSTLLVLRSAVRAFSPATTVSIGNVSCGGTVVSSDGHWLVTTTPTQAQMCSASGACVTATLVLTNPPASVGGGGGSSRRAADADDTSTTRGAKLSCPPFCPNMLPAAAVPFAMSSGDEFVPAFVQSTASGKVIAPIDTTSIAESTTGIFYAVSCTASGLYTDPTTGACTNASDPRSARCAFGSGDSCQACPTGALCPGGSFAWPLPGYYSASASLPRTLPCTPPDPTERCAGWNALTGKTQCGPTYRQGSYMCESCAVGAYAPGDGSCRLCPIVKGAWDRFSGLLILISAIVAFAIVVYVCLFLFIRAVGGTVSNGVKNLITLMIW